MEPEPEVVEGPKDIASRSGKLPLRTSALEEMLRPTGAFKRIAKKWEQELLFLSS